MRMRRFTPSPAMVVASFALLVALGGTGWAAANALLPRNSVGTQQVIDHSLLAVDFKQGQLPLGAQGPSGETGPAGPAGAFATTLPSGKTLQGAYYLGWTAPSAVPIGITAISFGIPLASAPKPRWVLIGSTAPPECGGSVTAPTAAPGNLCIYEGAKANIGAQVMIDPATSAAGTTARPYGIGLLGRAASAGDFYSTGVWAVTAP